VKYFRPVSHVAKLFEMLQYLVKGELWLGYLNAFITLCRNEKKHQSFETSRVSCDACFEKERERGTSLSLVSNGNVFQSRTRETKEVRGINNTFNKLCIFCRDPEKLRDAPLIADPNKMASKLDTKALARAVLGLNLSSLVRCPGYDMDILDCIIAIRMNIDCPYGNPNEYSHRYLRILIVISMGIFVFISDYPHRYPRCMRRYPCNVFLNQRVSILVEAEFFVVRLSRLLDGEATNL